MPSSPASATASFAASSGRQRTTRSASDISAFRAAGSLRFSGAIASTSTPATLASRSRISIPVVPASPSMKIAGLIRVWPAVPGLPEVVMSMCIFPWVAVWR